MLNKFKHRRSQINLVPNKTTKNKGIFCHFYGQTVRLNRQCKLGLFAGNSKIVDWGIMPSLGLSALYYSGFMLL